MRKFLFGVGILSTVLVTIILIFIGYGAYISSGQEEEGKQFSDNAIISIISHWDFNELRSRGSDPLLKSLKPDDLASLFVLFGSLGPLVDYQGSSLERWNVSIATKDGNVINAAYKAHAKYKNGQAEIICNLIKVSNAWKINGFRVNSPVLIENKVGRNM
jgi:hypothetical protein